MLIPLKAPGSVTAAAGTLVVKNDGALWIIKGNKAKKTLDESFDMFCPDGEHVWGVKPLEVCKIAPKTGDVIHRRPLLDEKLLIDDFGLHCSPVSAVLIGGRLFAMARNHLLRLDGPHVVDEKQRFWGLAVHGNTVAVGRRTGAIELRDAETLELRSQLTGLTQPILAMAFSPDGKYLVAADDFEGLRIFDLASGESREKEGLRKVVAICWRADGKRFVAIELTRRFAEFSLEDPAPRWVVAPEGFDTRYFRDGALVDDRILAISVEDRGILLAELKP